MIKSDINIKLEKLKDHLKSLHSVAVAFSGGVDSTYLLKVASDVRGDKVIAITERSLTYPERGTGKPASMPNSLESDTLQ